VSTPDDTRADTTVIEQVPDEPAQAPEPEAPEQGPETAPQPSLVRPYLQDDPHPWPVFDAVGGPERASGILPCGRCGKVHEDPDATAWSGIHRMLQASAHAAGWGIDQVGTWCCPDCLGKAPSVVAAMDWDDGLGTALYEERLAAHCAVLAEADRFIAARREERRESLRTARQGLRLRIREARARIREMSEVSS
jgi:hypothetical protein